MKTQEILKMNWAELNKLNEKDIRELYQTLSATANKRIKRLKASSLGAESPAFRELPTTVQKSGFSSKTAKNRNQMLNNMKVLKNYLSDKTSTVTGFYKVSENLANRLGVTIGKSKANLETISETRWRQFWKVYRQAKRNNPDLFQKGESTDRQKELMTFIKGKRRSFDTTLKKFQDFLNNLYIEKQAGDDAYVEFYTELDDGEDLPY